MIKETRYGYIDGSFTGKIIGKRIFLNQSDDSAVETAKIMINVDSDEHVDQALLGSISPKF